MGIAALVLILGGCGSHEPRATRPIGDPDGVAIEFTVDFTWQYLDAMGPLMPAYPNAYVSPPPSVVYIGPGAAGPQVIYSTGGPGPYGYPYDNPYGNPYDNVQPVYYSAGYQHVFLLAGNGPVQAECFHRRLHPGHHRFLARVRPGRTITLSIQADGNRNGWKVIGHVTAAGQDGGRVHIVLDASGSVLQVFPPREYPVGPADAPSASDSQVITPRPAAVQPPPGASANVAPGPAPAATTPPPVAPAATSGPAPVDPTSDTPVPTQALPAAPAPAGASQP